MVEPNESKIEMDFLHLYFYFHTVLVHKELTKEA
jgi:hypothetical protein